jgi:hypothetical protein
LREGEADEAISIEQCAHDWLGIAASLPLLAMTAAP